MHCTLVSNAQGLKKQRAIENKYSTKFYNQPSTEEKMLLLMLAKKKASHYTNLIPQRQLTTQWNSVMLHVAGDLKYCFFIK